MFSHRIVKVECHRGNVDVFGENAGTQCTAIALLFLSLSFQIPCDLWQSDHNMMAMHYGTQLYSTVINSR